MGKYGAYLAAGFAFVATVVGGLITVNANVSELMLLVRMLGAGLVFVGLAVITLALVVVRD